MANAIKEIMRFQSDRLLDKQRHNAINEATNIIEELLEIQSGIKLIIVNVKM